MKANVNSKQKTNKPEVDSVVVVHPVEHDLGSSVPTSRHVAGHFVLSRPENHRFIQMLFFCVLAVANTSFKPY